VKTILSNSKLNRPAWQNLPEKAMAQRGCFVDDDDDDGPNLLYNWWQNALDRILSDGLYRQED
jgi:hypothetical protein